MKAILINPKNHSEEKFISDLLKKLKIASRQMSQEEVEDYGMSVLMKEADRNKRVSRENIMKKLGS
jgi:hypothetical protein